MSSELTSAATALARLKDEARDYIAAAKSANTIRAYRADWKHFSSWCEAHGLAALPATPETVALYLSFLAPRRRASTLARRLASLGKAHQAAGFESPTTLQHAVVSETLKGIRRTYGTAQEGKAPTLTPDVQAMCAALPDTLAGSRDRALLLLGFAGGFRRSELSGLDHGDLRFSPEGLVVLLRRSKTDQEGQGRQVAVPYGRTEATCPVRACQEWLRRAGVEDGPVFRPVTRLGKARAARLHKNSVGEIVKRAAKAAGLDPASYAGHSLRAGHATQAYLNGANELSIMRQTGHRSLATVRRYIRNASLFRDNAAGKLGL